MKIITTVFMFFLLNYRSGYTLQCYIGGCENNKCHQLGKMTCGTGQACGSVETTINDVTLKNKLCVADFACEGFKDTATNVGGFPVTNSVTHCCRTDLCNSAAGHRTTLATAGLLVLLALYLSRM